MKDVQMSASRRNFFRGGRLLVVALAALYLWGCGVSPAYAEPVSQNPETIRALLLDQQEKSGVKALLAGVWVGDKEVITVALGESMTSVPARLDMHVRIGGVSETFLGTLFMRLVEAGSIRLEDKVARWLPSLLAADRVTLGMLMKNTAGYKDYVYNPDFIKRVSAQPFQSITRSEIYAYATGDGQLNYPPGTGQKYSHTDFTILGDCLERATGKSMAELYQKEIFEPVGLKETGYSSSPDLPAPLLHAFSSDRGVYEEATFWNPSWSGESGPLYSTLPDLRVWAKAFGHGSLLTPQSFAELVARPAGATNPDLYFASGFVVDNGWYLQNPSFNGYSGAFGYLPAQDMTLVVYTTQSENPKSDAQAFQILKKLAALLAPQTPIHI